MTRLSWLEV